MNPVSFHPHPIHRRLIFFRRIYFRIIYSSIVFIILSILQPFSLLASEHFFNPTAPYFPIAVWKAFPINSVPSDTELQWIRDAGINIVSELFNDSSVIIPALTKVNEYNLKMVIGGDYVTDLNHLREIVPRLNNNQALLGYYLIDEPKENNAFSNWARYRNVIVNNNSQKLAYINLWPATNQYSDNYSEYLDNYIHTFNPQVLSVDIYPIRRTVSGEYRIYSRYYETYETLAEKSKQYNIPWMACCASTGTPEFLKPNKGNMRFSAFTALAYGAQSICWWTYIRPQRNPDYFLISPVMDNGKRTTIWYALRDVNKEIQSLKNVFLGTEVQGVWHTGKDLPRGTKRLGTLPSPITSLTSGKSGVLVSHLNTDGREYVVIVTHDYENSQKVNLKGDPNHLIKRVFPDGTEKKVKWGSFTISAGGYIIFRIK